MAALRKQFLDAYDSDLLKTGSEGIHRSIQMERDKEGMISGGVKSFRRNPADARLVRDDGAWIHFTISVRPKDGTLELLAYDFEIVFPAGHAPAFLRLDLNPEDHPNAGRELRSHAHPGHDDIQIPAPVMTPEEILELMLRGLRARDPDKPRFVDT